MLPGPRWRVGLPSVPRHRPVASGDDRAAPGKVERLRRLLLAPAARRTVLLTAVTVTTGGPVSAGLWLVMGSLWGSRLWTMVGKRFFTSPRWRQKEKWDRLVGLLENLACREGRPRIQEREKLAGGEKSSPVLHWLTVSNKAVALLRVLAPTCFQRRLHSPANISGSVRGGGRTPAARLQQRRFD